jgi:hypothetical protein
MFEMMIQIGKYADLKHSPNTIPEEYRDAYPILCV